MTNWFKALAGPVVMALLLLSASAAQAQQKAQPFAGVSISVGGSLNRSGAEVDLSVPGPGSIINLDGLGLDGATGFVQANFDVAIGKARVGAFARYDGIGEQTFDLSIPVASLSILSASIEKEMKFGPRFGWVFGDSLFAYVGAYYAQGDLNWSLLNGALTDSKRMTGYGALVGLEWIPIKEMPQFFTALEAGRTKWNDVDYDLGGATLSIKTESDWVGLRGGLRLN